MRVQLLEYDRNNVVSIFNLIGNKTFILSSESVRDLLRNRDEDSEKSIDFLQKFNYIDLSLLIIYDNERVELWAPIVITVFQWFEKVLPDAKFIIDKRYSKDIKDALYHFVESIIELEKELGLSDVDSLNIVDISEDNLLALQTSINNNLFGNSKFKVRLFEEIRKFRIFNEIEEQAVFSVFICGESGLGKTETARLMHAFLSPKEKFIKINLGNYSARSALSSLIGSPRGYIGSSKGELSDKIHTSKSTVILIDEFEKSRSEVHNFFLELLSDGKFTDSLGREHNLNKYIIVFTSNIKDEDVNDKIPPELRSRFDLMYRMIQLSKEEKIEYINYRCRRYIEKIEKRYQIIFSNDSLAKIQDIDVSKFNNLRNLNKQIQINISNEFQASGLLSSK